MARFSKRAIFSYGWMCWTGWKPQFHSPNQMRWTSSLFSAHMRLLLGLRRPTESCTKPFARRFSAANALPCFLISLHSFDRSFRRENGRAEMATTFSMSSSPACSRSRSPPKIREFRRNWRLQVFARGHSRVDLDTDFSVRRKRKSFFGVAEQILKLRWRRIRRRSATPVELHHFALA